MRLPDKATIVIILLCAVLVCSVGASIFVFQQRQEAVTAKADAVAERARQNSALLHDRIVIGRVRSQITEDAIRELCHRMNAKFGKLIPLEKQGREQILHSALFKGHEDERKKNLRLVNNAIAALQPESCNIKIAVESVVRPPTGENG